MNEHHKQIIDYIQQHLQLGHSEQDIRTKLVEHHWPEEVINQGFAAVQQGAPSPESVQAAPPAQQVYQDHALPQPAHDTQLAADHLYPESFSQPQTYKVFRAIGDVIRAIRTNPLAYFVSAIIVIVVAFASLFLLIFAGGLIFGVSSATGLFASRTGQMIPLILFIAVIYLVWICLIQGMLLATTSFALFDGINGQKSKIAPILSTGLKRMWRVALANILFYLIVLLPFFAITIIGLIVSFASGGSGSIGLNIIFILAALGGLTWAIIGLLRYSLMPYVALFEPDTKPFQTMKRSQHLLAKGGQWFLFKGFLLVLLAGIIFTIAFPGSTDGQESAVLNILGFVISIAVNIVTYGALTMLYLNRRAVRG